MEPKLTQSDAVNDLAITCPATAAGISTPVIRSFQMVGQLFAYRNKGNDPSKISRQPPVRVTRGATETKLLSVEQENNSAEQQTHGRDEAFALRSAGVSILGRGCVKTQNGARSQKIGFPERAVFDYFGLGNGWKTPEIEIAMRFHTASVVS